MGQRSVTVELTLIGEAAEKYKLQEGSDTFTINGTINPVAPDLTLTLSKSVCTTTEKLLPLLSVDGVSGRGGSDLLLYGVSANYRKL